jgi:dTDP-4-amino-4,6-dideoxygalactose transaminase
MKVPLFDITRQYNSFKEEMLQAIDQVISSGQVILGPEVSKLETTIADYVGVKEGIGVANGSDALFIALDAMGIKERDHVITTPYSFFATVSCITRLGAIPIFADIDPITFNINLNQVEEILKNHPQKDKIKTIIPVHLFGQTVDLEKLEALRKQYGIKILEDCAQSIGSCWIKSDGSVIKSAFVGNAATFSFYPTKNLGGYGDGGMIVTSNKEIAEKCKTLRKHGSKKKYYHELIGINSRLDELQAAILNVKFKRLQDYIEKRKAIATKYAQLFKENNLEEAIEYPEPKNDNTHVYHQYVIRIKKGNRDNLRKHLTEQNIGTSIYYPKPLHLQPCFEYLGYKEGDLPEAEKACHETLALPIFPEMEEKEIEYIVKKVKQGLEKHPSNPTSGGVPPTGVGGV